MAELQKKVKQRNEQRNQQPSLIAMGTAVQSSGGQTKSQDALEQFMAKQKLILTQLRQEVENSHSDNARLKNELLNKSEAIRNLQKLWVNDIIYRKKILIVFNFNGL